MVGKCANAWCSASRQPDGGKLFSVEINLSNQAGEQQRRTVFLWLCARCAREMSPRVDVCDNKVSVRLAAITPKLPEMGTTPLPRVQ